MSLKTYFSEDVDKYWTVTTTQKVGCYGQTRSLGVIARTAQEAIRKVIDSFPETTVTSCNHKGAVDIN